MNVNFNSDKGYRLLNIFERLSKGECVNKEQLATDYGVSAKTIQRDFDDLRAYFAENNLSSNSKLLKYDKSSNTYCLVSSTHEWLTNEEAVALCKILLESRAFQKEELVKLIDKLIMQISPKDRLITENIIRSELYNYVPLQHGKPLLSVIWCLSELINEQKIIKFSYKRQDGKTSKKEVMPVSIMFSEFYFYLIAFSTDSDVKYPIIFRIDRIEDIKSTGETFFVPYKDRFSDGEFRKRIQFMYSGELKKVKFEYSGVLEAILDRLPTAKIIDNINGVYIITAETYGDGIYMWLRSQGDLVRILSD